MLEKIDYAPISENSQLCRFIEVWDNARKQAGVDVPERSLIRLQDLKDLAPHISILDIGPDREAVFRISGSAIDHIMKQNLSGTRMADISTDDAIRRVSWFHWKVMSHPCGGYVHDVLQNRSGQRFEYKAVSLPLAIEKADHGQDITISLVNPIGFSSDLKGVMRELFTDELKTAHFFDIGFGAPELPGG